MPILGIEQERLLALNQTDLHLPTLELEQELTNQTAHHPPTLELELELMNQTAHHLPTLEQELMNQTAHHLPTHQTMAPTEHHAMHLVKAAVHQKERRH